MIPDYTLMKNFRTILGALWYDLPQFLWSMLPGRMANGDPRWVRMRNRNDRLTPNPNGAGVMCDWEYTRPLHICRVFPATGNWLARRALKDWPACFKEVPGWIDGALGCDNRGVEVDERTPSDGTPQVSFLIGHRGTFRLPQLQTTLRSIAGQQGVRFECIVVEQGDKPQARDQLPEWVRYIHTPCHPDTPYVRARAFNEAASHARGSLLICHDNDLVVPSAYASECDRLWRDGYEVINAKRFIVYLRKGWVLPRDADRVPAATLPVADVLENARGGGSIAVAAAAFNEIGGFDEDFVGWGGEDEEFWDRCQARRVCRFGHLPLLHLWHGPQPGKRDSANPTLGMLSKKMALPRDSRIRELVQAKRTGSSIRARQEN